MVTSSKASQPDEDDQQSQERPPRLEWTVAAFGLLIVLATLGVLTYQALGAGESPADIVNRVVAVRPVTGGHLVQVEVRNNGGETTAGLIVKGTLKQGERDVETSEVTLNYVPGRSTREAGLFFTENPQRYRLELRALGYQEP
jgi:uncharacterized protein (TIGR02588 family)